MTDKSTETLSRLNQVTQRLDHMVPDNVVTKDVNEKAAAELAALSERLALLLPDPSLSPLERLERLARVVQDRVPHSDQLQPALEKVSKLKTRLDELVPGRMSAEDKIITLAKMAYEKAGGDKMTCVEALERMGDPRAGVDPVK